MSSSIKRTQARGALGKRRQLLIAVACIAAAGTAAALGVPIEAANLKPIT